MKGLFVGLTTVDIQFFVDHYPESNTKSIANDIKMLTGGPAANAAITFSALGGDADLVSVIGKNILNGFIFNELDKYRITMIDKAAEIKLSPVIAGVVTSLDNGNRTVLASLPDGLKDSFTVGFPHDFDICLIDGFYLNWVKEIALFACKKNIPLVMDGGSWKEGLDEILGFVNYAICSADFYPPGCKSHKQTFDFLRKRGIKNVAITRGENPIMVYENNRYSEINVKQTIVKDTLGAGDIFHGAFCYYFMKEPNFVNALTQASLIATESCRYQGTREWINYIY